MSLYTVAEICQQLLYYFSMPAQTDLLSHKCIDTHIKLAEKFDFDVSSLHESLFPLETLANQFLETITPYVNKPRNKDEDILYGIFIKLVAFYMLARRLSNALRTENTDYFLTGIKAEVEYILTDIENNYFLFLYGKELKNELITKITDCLNRLNTIIQLPENIYNRDITNFLHRANQDVSLADINNMFHQLLYSVSDYFIKKVELSSTDAWFKLLNSVSEQCFTIFYEKQHPILDANETLQLIIEQNLELKEIFSKIAQKNIIVHHTLHTSIYCQYLLSYFEFKTDDRRISILLKLIYEFLIFNFEEFQSVFEIDSGTIKLLTHKIKQSLCYMLTHEILLRPKNILEMEFEKIQLNNILDTLFDLSYELLEENNSVQSHYNELIDFTTGHPVNLNEYVIPVRSLNGPQNFLRDKYSEVFPEKKEHYSTFLQQHPLLLDFISLYYFVFSLTIYPHAINQSRIVIFLYENLLSIIKNKIYHKKFIARTNYFKQALIRIAEYFIFLCDKSTVNAFIIRALQLDFSIVATFSQGTREYFEEEDGLCAGYVYQLAEYMLIDQSENPSLSKRSHRWNIKSQPSPFRISQESPYRLVMANQRTYDFQSKPLVDVTDAIQMVHGSSGFRFNSGAEIAQKLLEMLKEHPNSILLLGMWEKGEKIGHAIACFTRGNLLHFFCATHCWVTIPYYNANPAFHAFLHMLYAELSFFNQYTHYFIDVIYRTWEAPPIDHKNFHYEHDENLMPYAFEDNFSEKLQQTAVRHIQMTISNKIAMLEKILDQT